MENEKLNVAEEMQKLEFEIGKDLSDLTVEELKDVKTRIQRMSSEIEDTLKNSRSVPRDAALRMVERLNDEIIDFVQKEIASTRKSEYEETRYNISTIGNVANKETIDKLGMFEQDGGIVNRDNRFEQTLEEVSDRIVNAYRKPLEQFDSRRSDDVVWEIKNIVNRAKVEIMESHTNCSDKIRRQAKRKVEELGIKLTAEVEQTLDTELQVEPKKEMSPFEASLKSGTVSEEEMAKEDAKDLTETDTEMDLKIKKELESSTKEALEALFK